MIALFLILPANVLALTCVLVAVAVLYGLVCFIKALRTPPDTWTEINKIGGFPKRKE